MGHCLRCLKFPYGQYCPMHTKRARVDGALFASPPLCRACSSQILGRPKRLDGEEYCSDCLTTRSPRGGKRRSKRKNQ